MKTAEDIYLTPPSRWECQPMLSSFGVILLQINNSDNQGKSIILYFGNRGFGVLIFDWDYHWELQTCCTIKNTQKLMDDVYGAIKWFDKLDDLKKYVDKMAELLRHDASWKGKCHTIITYIDNVLREKLGESFP